MTNDAPNPVDPEERIRQLETELARVRTERDFHKQTVYDLLRDDDFDRPLTPEEIEEMLHGPRSAPLLDLVAEFEQAWAKK